MSDDTKTHRILRLILYLSNGYPRTKEECLEFLFIKDTAFYSYIKLLNETGFDVRQREGRYWIDCSVPDSRVLFNVLHFSEEELYLLSECLGFLEERTGVTAGLRDKLVSFLNQDKAIENYILKKKTEKELVIQRAIRNKHQVLLMNYSSGNSGTVRNRLVEPYEFRDDFNLLWAFELDTKQNRQFKVSRAEDVAETTLCWEYEYMHRSKPVDIFRNTGDLDKEIHLILNVRARNLLVEEYPLSGRHLTKIRVDRFGLEVKVAKYEGPGRFVMGLIDDIEVVGDEGFIGFLKSKKKNM